MKFLCELAIMFGNVESGGMNHTFRFQGRTREVAPHPLSVFIGRLVIVATAVLFGLILIRNPLKEWVIYAPVGLAIGIPGLIPAELFLTRVEVGAEGVTQYGLLNQRSHIPWDSLEKIHLYRGVVGNREMVVYGGRKKIAITNEMFLIPRKGFRPAAEAIVAQADRQGVPVKTGFFTGRKGWFGGGE